MCAGCRHCRVQGELIVERIAYLYYFVYYCQIRYVPIRTRNAEGMPYIITNYTTETHLSPAADEEVMSSIGVQVFASSISAPGGRKVLPYDTSARRSSQKMRASLESPVFAYLFFLLPIELNEHARRKVISFQTSQEGWSNDVRFWFKNNYDACIYELKTRAAVICLHFEHIGP